MNRLLLVFPAVIALVSCGSNAGEFPSLDCTGPVPAQFTRIFIGTPAAGGQQSGTSAGDPLDGTTADKFDTILRTIAEGKRPTWGTQTQIAPENLIVCINAGTFETNGQFDWVVTLGHNKGANNTGFTVEKNWRIHGQGADQTRLKLAGFVPDQFLDRTGNTFSGGSNVVIGTHSVDASGVEISDLTIDANHDNLNRVSGLPLNLEAIVLRSLHGGHWIHDLNVIGASGDLGGENIFLETFPIRIWGDSQDGDPSQSSGNIIENVTLTQPGRAVGNSTFPGGALTGIAVTSATGEVRKNLVDGYSIAFGGFDMGAVNFHDNIAQNMVYGFNADSFSNNGVTIQSNQFIHPAAYGIVIGGSEPQQKFLGWKVLNNIIAIDTPGTVGLVLRGQVQISTFAGNKIFSDQAAKPNVIAIWSYPSGPGVANFGNTFVNNQLDITQRIDFSQDPFFHQNCRFMNRDLQERPRLDFPDNSAGCSSFSASVR